MSIMPRRVARGIFMKTQTIKLLTEEHTEIELFHLIHKALMLINEYREQDEQVKVFDREIGEAVKQIVTDNISRNLTLLILNEYSEDLERKADMES